MAMSMTSKIDGRTTYLDAAVGARIVIRLIVGVK